MKLYLTQKGNFKVEHSVRTIIEDCRVMSLRLWLWNVMRTRCASQKCTSVKRTEDVENESWSSIQAFYSANTVHTLIP